jgi:hypothetical protein
MSKATELAQAEAARAEAEAPDDEPTEPAEPTEPTEPGPAPGEPTTDEEGEEADADEHGGQTEPTSATALPRDSLTISDELNKKREDQAKSQARNVERLADEYGQDVMPCPLCERVDIAPLIVSKLVAIPAEGWAALAQMGGVEPEPPHKMAEGVVGCDRCNTWGELDYPTLNEHMKRQTCPACAGNGYVPEQQAEQPQAPVFQLPSIPSAPAPPAPQYAGNDQWGRQPGHPHYGLDPAGVMP